MSTTEITPAVAENTEASAMTTAVPQLEGVEEERYTYVQIKHTKKSADAEKDDEVEYYGILEAQLEDELKKNEAEKYKGKETFEEVGRQTMSFPKPVSYVGIGNVFAENENEAAAMTYRGLKVKFQNYLRTAFGQTDEGEPTFEFQPGVMSLLDVARQDTRTRSTSVSDQLSRFINKSVGHDEAKKQAAIEALKKQLAALEAGI